MPSQHVFRTPYRERGQFTPDQDTCTSQSSNQTTICGASPAGDMLDAIGRSQKYSQQQRKSQRKKMRKSKLKKTTSRRAEHTYREAEPIAQKITRETPKTPPSKVARIESLRQQTSPVQVETSVLSSEVYEFPDSPNRAAVENQERRFYRRLAERQVLRTIKKMSEDLQIFRRRLEQLTQPYVEFV